MIHLANILIAADDAALGQSLLGNIRRHGYYGRVVASQDAALSTAQQERPDIVLLGPTLDGGDPISLTKALKAIPECIDIPVCLVTLVRSCSVKTQALGAGMDDVLMPPLGENKLAARLRPLVRLATMHTELRKRARSAKRFGIDAPASAPHPEAQSGYPVLIVGEDGEALTAPLALAKLSVATDPFKASDLLSGSNFDAAIITPEADSEPYLDLCAQIRNNPRLFNLPMLIVNKDGRVSESDAYHHGASGYFNHPVDSCELNSTVVNLVRRQRRRWALRGALQQTLQGAAKDDATGVYSRAFLDAYLADRVNFAKTHGRHLSIMFFRVPDVEGVRQHFGQEQADHLRLQVAQWITSLLRGEDLTARFEENEFCVVLPDTPREEALVVMHRIAGVLTYTDFAVKEVYQPVKVWARAGSADLTPDDDMASLVARARHDIT